MERKCEVHVVRFDVVTLEAIECITFGQFDSTNVDLERTMRLYIPHALPHHLSLGLVTSYSSFQSGRREFSVSVAPTAELRPPSDFSASGAFFSLRR